MIEILEKLAAANIRIVPADGISTHFVLERTGYVALVERRGEGFGSIGSPGLLTDRGFAALIRRGPDAWFVARGLELKATPEQVAAVRSFAADLAAALESCTTQRSRSGQPPKQ